MHETNREGKTYTSKEDEVVRVELKLSHSREYNVYAPSNREGFIGFPFR
jgi:hypothetical protein